MATETKFCSEPSLFEAFGANVSEQMKATNKRAAERSMENMARVLNHQGQDNKRSHLGE
ncbi:hypothetical protein JHE03_00560 [Pluralibacter gergoviae]|uniref:hypothetical protein n=1 Tax=Pluralibacter gergoviae TaxID=61647 RepID=UPI00190B85FC|nr:hypothetical protein [Pluralibacter gergoviae]ELC3073605.1 hypothetical protein [Pluralibacter gergoviae]MBK4114789.1 hypothetical protein [Pluralibacter gergoviae]HDS1234681.1 hypothetical protein [Pluralibacter gergoviae]HDS1241025.1 hypothetical protein [Pluralibacter gergoviae]HDS1247024.1 hypothetical protein [Pluralibacter gergoviae]